jgi:ribokinase
MTVPRLLVIDTDPGIDDALALALAFASPEVEIPLITTVSGNTGLAAVTTNATVLLDLFGAPPETVLARGASRPLKRKLATAEEFHGPDGLGGVRDSLVSASGPSRPVKSNAVGRLLKLIGEYGSDVVIVALGPLTNIAKAVMKDVAVMRTVGRLVIMGGAVRVSGNTTPGAEFNFYADPHAADVVFRAGLPITLIPLDATEQVRLNDAQLRNALKGRRDPVATALRKMTKFSMARHGSEGMALHDPLAIAAAIAPDLVSTTSVPVCVITDGESTAGMTLEDARPFSSSTPQGNMIDVAFDVDVPRAANFFLERLSTFGAVKKPELAASERVVVVGGANIDLVVKARTLPRAGETVSGNDLIQTEGGKGANQAVAARRAGADVSFIARLGNDVFGRRAHAKLVEAGIDCTGVSYSSRATGVALIAVDQHGQNQISVAPGANDELSASLVGSLAPHIAGSKVLVVQLESPLESTIAALEIARSAGVVTILNPAPVCSLPKHVPGLVDILVANEVEAEALVGQPVRTVPEVRRALDALLTLGYAKPVITLGRRGVMYRADGRLGRVKALSVTSVDATAAGDTFVGYLAAGIAAGASLAEAVEMANRASAVTVTRMGAQSSIPHKAELS